MKYCFLWIRTNVFVYFALQYIVVSLEETTGITEKFYKYLFLYKQTSTWLCTSSRVFSTIVCRVT